MINHKIKSICIIIDAWYPIYGGGQVYVSEMIQHLSQEYDLDIDIITRKIKGDLKDSNEIINSNKVKVIKIRPKSNFNNSFARIYFIIASLIYLIFKKSYTLYVPQSILPGIVGKILSIIKKRPVILTVHGSILTSKFYRTSWLMVWLEKFILTKIRYTKIISVSREFAKIPNINKEICIIPNGVDVKKFDSILIKKNKKPTLLFVGRLDRVKGVDYLVKAVDILINKYKKDIVLNLVGYGYEEKKLRTMVSQFGLDRNINFLGKVVGDNLIKIYKKSWLFVLPSLSEGHPLTLLEAWASKLPVITTEVGDNEYYVKNRENGYLVESKNVEELANTIVSAINNSSLEVLGKSGYEFVKRELRWEDTFNKTFKVFRDVIADADSK